MAEITFQSLSKGNGGALAFLVKLSTSPEVPVRTVAKVQSSGLVGWQLHVLFADICDYDLKKVVNLMDKCPLNVLREACSRHDRSGKQLLAEYL